MASGAPIALLTKGTVREALGFASITKSSPPATAYWTLIRPITPSSSAILRVVSRISSSISSPRLIGGITQAESPEWTPASSTCCITPATTQRSPSASASTSTSIAFSRKRSKRSGCS